LLLALKGRDMKTPTAGRGKIGAIKLRHVNLLVKVLDYLAQMSSLFQMHFGFWLLLVVAEPLITFDQRVGGTLICRLLFSTG
jgi:hypothetical protein